MDLICSTVKLTCENKTNRGNKVAKRKKHHQGVDMRSSESLSDHLLFSLQQNTSNGFSPKQHRAGKQNRKDS